MSANIVMPTKATKSNNTGPKGSRWSPLKGAWVDSKGHIVKEGNPSKTNYKGVAAFTLIGIITGYMIVGNASSTLTNQQSKPVTKMVTYNPDNTVTFTEVKK